jgi:pimeloyl-ACP methyl ester carboxylesterase
MEGRMLQPPAIDRLDEFEVPMLVVIGELDMPGIHEIADLLVDTNPNAKRVVVLEAAHMVNLEQPEEFNRLLVAYLGQF